MAKQRPKKENKQQNKYPKPKPVAVEPTHSQFQPALAYNNGLQAQATHLNDPRLPTVQRQALAAQIGRVQGNRHLQQAI